MIWLRNTSFAMRIVSGHLNVPSNIRTLILQHTGSQSPSRLKLCCKIDCGGAPRRPFHFELTNAKSTVLQKESAVFVIVLFTLAEFTLFCSVQTTGLCRCVRYHLWMNTISLECSAETLKSTGHSVPARTERYVRAGCDRGHFPFLE